jgi:hypothetical protein
MTPPPFTQETLRQVVEWLEHAGGEFVLTLPSWLGLTSIDGARLLSYLRDPDAYLRQVLGVTTDELRQWQACQGVIQCHARRAGGRGPRCRNLLNSEGDYLPPADWVAWERQRPTCGVHGGGSLHQQQEKP